MSTEEQQALAGRTVLELVEKKRLLAVLMAKASEKAASMRRVVSDLEKGTITSVFDAERLPAGPEIVFLLGEIRDTKERIEELSSLLRAMGVTV